jgi:predicted permease
LGRVWRTFNEFMTVPLWAAILSLIVACVPPLQHALEQHMRPVKGALSQAGNCSIPLTLVVLGAYFYTPKDTVEGGPAARERALTTVRSSGSLFDSVRDIFKLKRSHQRGRLNGSASSVALQPQSRPGETKTVVIAILSRMIIVPMLLMPLLAVSTWYDWHAVFAE